MNARFFSASLLALLACGSLHACSSDDAGGGAGGSGARAGTTALEGGGSGGHGGSGHAGRNTGGSAANQGGAGGSAGTNDGGVREQGGSGPSHGGRSATGGSMPTPQGGTGGSEGGEAGAAAQGEAGAAAGLSASGAAGSGGETETGGAAGESGNPSCVDDLNLPLVDTPPATLDQTGLYTSPSSSPDDVAPYVYEFTPRYPLWSDGAVKRRFMYLPKCTRIDTSDMNHWKFPVGTRFWKEFTYPVDSASVRVETRFIHRYGPGDNDWLFISYQWDPNVASPTAGNTAPVPDGVENANGTLHDIPTHGQCAFCHANLPERILGFSAFELTNNPGTVTMAALSHEHLLTVSAPNGFSPPGTSVQQDGLGYLHTNCGGCHNAFRNVTPDGVVSPRMRLLVEQTTLEATDTYTTLCNVPTYNPDFQGIDRIAPGDDAHSEIIARMAQRGDLQMPPLATKVVDTDGVAKVAAFIDSLTP
jgi:hypothetical protein